MDSYYKVREEPLEQHELRQLKKGMWFIPVIMLIVCLVFFLLFKVVSSHDDALWPFIGFSVFFGLVLFYVLRGYVLDLKKQTKEVLTGVITLKEKRSKKKRKSKGSETAYFFHFGDKDIMVPVSVYTQFKEADLVEIHRSTRVANLIYKAGLIKRGVLVEEVKEVKKEHKALEQKMIFQAVMALITILLIILFIYLRFLN